jgi:hypothetical protein
MPAEPFVPTGTPIREYMPDDLGADSYARLARLLDAERARVALARATTKEVK